MALKIDHVVMGAADLDAGVLAMKAALGVTVPEGGKHPAMSTHNRLMQTGNETFFEVIAIDPDAPADPGRARWFSLDDPATRARLSERVRPLCWVVGTDDLDAVIAASPVDLGEPVALTRGDLSWRLTVPKDGSLTMGGLVPGFIEWPTGPLPATRMPDLGVRLKTIRLFHPEPKNLASILAALGVDHLATITKGPEGLAFEVDTPNGPVVLD